MSSAHTGNIERVKKALAFHDDTGLTTREVAIICKLTRDQAAGLIRCLHSVSPRFPEKRVYVYAWIHEGEPGEKEYPRALYKLGNKPDAPKPQRKSGPKRSRQYRDRQRAKNTSSSVFNLGNTGYRTAAQRNRAAEYAKRSDRGQLSLFPDAIGLNSWRTGVRGAQNTSIADEDDCDPWGG